MPNIFENLPEDLSKEHFIDIISTPGVRIERIVSKGHTSPEEGWYNQSENEWVIVVKGRAKLTFEANREVILNAGDYINIPAHTLHKVSWTDPGEWTIWLAVFY